MALNVLQRWRHLPRDARDTLFLLAVICWTVLPHVSHLPLWCSLLTAVMLLWRAQLALVNGPLPSRWWLATLLVMAAGLTLWTFRTSRRAMASGGRRGDDHRFLSRLGVVR